MCTELKRKIEIAHEIEDRMTEGVQRPYEIPEYVFKNTGIERTVVVVDRVDEIQGDLERFLDPLLMLMKNEEYNIKASSNTALHVR